MVRDTVTFPRSIHQNQKLKWAPHTQSVGWGRWLLVDVIADGQGHPSGWTVERAGLRQKGEGVAWFNNSLFTDFAEEMTLKKKREIPPRNAIHPDGIPIREQREGFMSPVRDRKSGLERQRCTLSAAMRVLQITALFMGRAHLTSRLLGFRAKQQPAVGLSLADHTTTCHISTTRCEPCQ
ncbi:hypothetical protein CDAR_379211 [Caerostris darwini]|uniref:Uncharacterized protein n=1 Tax=Caerostris darwini TaxID=1538125 RepID=A0AAV4R3K4_9ARAC|nr:hypothetical protein CDAR_379211 [Caerostris darwini]